MTSPIKALESAGPGNSGCGDLPLLDDRKPRLKVIVAIGDEPWQGTAYATRGGPRLTFSNIAELFESLSHISGWAAHGVSHAQS